MDDENAILEPLEASMRQRLDCWLCGKAADMRGVFIPIGEMSQKIGAPVGKTRVVIYPICSTCHLDPFSEIRIEEILMQQAAAARN